MSSLRYGKTGSSYRVLKAVPIRDSLIDAVLGPPTTPRKPKDETVYVIHGPKKRKPKTTGLKHPDSVILECRRLHEMHHWPPSMIARALGLKSEEIYNIRDYHTRAHLVPTEDICYHPHKENA